MPDNTLLITIVQLVVVGLGFAAGFLFARGIRNGQRTGFRRKF